MAAKWTWGSIEIFVSEQAFSRASLDAEIHVLDSSDTTVQHLSGGSEKQSIAGLVITQASIDTILSDAAAGTNRTFTSDQGSEGTFQILGEPEAERIHYQGGVIDGVAYDGTVTPIFKIAMDVIKTA